MTCRRTTDKARDDLYEDKAKATHDLHEDHKDIHDLYEDNNMIRHDLYEGNNKARLWNTARDRAYSTEQFHRGNQLLLTFALCYKQQVS